MKILVVEDEKKIASFIRMGLETAGADSLIETIRGVGYRMRKPS